MVVRREKKSRKMHGYRTRGWGSVGQHRKSGSKGGVGAAGFHKHYWSWVVKYFPDWFGKRGFTPRGPEHTPEHNVINVGRINEIVEEMLRRREVMKEDGMIVVDVASMGYSKVLGEGKIRYPVKLIALRVSRKAEEKIRAAGGTVVLLGSEKSG
ncbi:MAG: 50S ribosomal protein L15 [Thermoprotei archaeon]|nr:MAG: 50S ribosomal protein L15 [Thermoprotei archaeon]